jgi:hypothetical protein
LLLQPEEYIEDIEARAGLGVDREAACSWIQWHSGVFLRASFHLLFPWGDELSVDSCSETMLTGESRFHISTTLGIEPGSLMTGSKGLTLWTSETVYECSEITGST